MDVIEKPENDPEWWKCRKINGMVGLVPKNYVTIMQNNPLTSGLEPSPPQCDYIRPSLTGKFAGNPWYYGKVTRHQAEMALNERGHEGDFLIRDSESSVSWFSKVNGNRALNIKKKINGRPERFSGFRKINQVVYLLTCEVSE